MITKKNRFFFILALLVSFQSYADLLISPTRVTFAERQRVAKVIVVNDSQEYKTYRLQWQEKQAKPAGGYITFDKDYKNPQAISSMVRISPSQVRLAPGERQIIKLALRKPAGLADNEYRSHLVFRALPNKEAANSKQFGIRLNMILSYSIPVILRSNIAAPLISIETLARVQKDNISYFNIGLSHQGAASSFGKIEAFYKAQGQNDEQKVAILNDYSIYPEIDHAQVSLSLFENTKLAFPGKLRIIYTGKDVYEGTVFSEKTWNITSQGISEH